MEVHNSSLTAEAMYKRLESDRWTFLDRARRCSEITIPTLVPPQSHSKSTIYYTPWQGIGARGVNNLASKLLLSLMPPNSPFFRLQVDDITKAELAGDPSKGSAVEEGLAKIERVVQSEIESLGLRSPVFLALKHLIVAGNYLLYIPKDGNVKGYRLDSFVVQRDVFGNVLQIIAKDTLSELTVSDEIRALIDGPAEASLEKKEKTEDDFSHDASETIDVYTRLYRTDDNRWKLCQEVQGKEVPGSHGSWPIEKCPMIALRWTAIENEDYGRSYVEEYLGDLISLEGLSKAIVQASAAAAKVVFFVKPNGLTKIKDIVKAESGDVVVGNKDDIGSMQTEKQADMKIAYEAAKTITERLAAAFLMNQSVQRDAERVTAEEVRFMASELEDALGGVYSILSQEFQLPLINRLMDRMTKQKKLPDLPKGVVKPVIVTGLEALGRGHDLNKYMQLIKIIKELPPEVTQMYVNLGDALTRIVTALGIDPAGLIKSADEVATQQQQMQQQAVMGQMADIAGKAAPAIVKGMSDQSLQASEQAAPQQPTQ